jgi:hypothetical protein
MVAAKRARRGYLARARRRSMSSSTAHCSQRRHSLVGVSRQSQRPVSEHAACRQRAHRAWSADREWRYWLRVFGCLITGGATDSDSGSGKAGTCAQGEEKIEACERERTRALGRSAAGLLA